MTDLAISPWMRATPWTSRVEEAGVAAYNVYNHMLLASHFGDPEAENAHLRRAVQVWDVACERQVEIRGPDAARLVQKMTPRDLSKAEIDQCFYVPLVDADGGMLNDPVAIKLADDRYWLSIANSDVLLYAKGLAYGMGADAEVFEPEVDILAIQGPKADDLAARIFGDGVRDIRFFRGGWFDYRGREMFVARSGYSKQGGFEVYVEGRKLALPLWDELFETGADLDVRVGCPNQIDRIEAGMMSYGTDMTVENDPFECGLGKFVKEGVGCVADEALAHKAKDGPKRMIRGLRIEGGRPPGLREPWPLWSGDGKRAGRATSVSFSPTLDTVIATGMVEREFWESGTRLHIETPEGVRGAEVAELPFTKD